MMEVQT
nr:unnamed protein product [Callosobruchus chinensis]